MCAYNFRASSSTGPSPAAKEGEPPQKRAKTQHKTGKRREIKGNQSQEPSPDEEDKNQVSQGHSKTRHYAAVVIVSWRVTLFIIC